jgi:PAS domain-containing protein
LALSDEIAGQVAAMSAVEHALLASRNAAAEGADKESLALIAFGALFAVSFVGLAGVFIARSLAALRLRNEALAFNERHMRQLNQELSEQRAATEQRSHDLEASEQALQRQTDLFQAILEGLAEGVLARAIDGRLLLFNPAARRILPGSSFDPESTLATFLEDYESFLDEFGAPAPLAKPAVARDQRDPNRRRRALSAPPQHR